MSYRIGTQTVAGAMLLAGSLLAGQFPEDRVLYFPQVAAGGGERSIETVITVTNPGPDPASLLLIVQLDARDDHELQLMPGETQEVRVTREGGLSLAGPAAPWAASAPEAPRREQ